MPPSPLGAIAAECDRAGCPRDAVVTVSAVLDEAQLSRAEGWLVLAPAVGEPASTPRTPLAKSSLTGRYEGRILLAETPLAAGALTGMTVHVAASDGSGRITVEAAGPSYPVSRLRGLPLDLGEPASAPTVDAAGRVLLAGTSGAALVVTPDLADGSAILQKLPYDLSGMAAAPAAGPGGAWFSSPASLSVGLARDDGSSSSFTCSANGSKTAGLLAATTPAAGGLAFAPGGASSNGQQVYVLSPSLGTCKANTVGVQLTTPFVSLGGKLYAATRTPQGEVDVSRFTPNAKTGALAVDSWSATLRAGAFACDAVTVPLAYDAFHHLVVVCDNGQLWIVDPEGEDGHSAIYLRTFQGATSGSPLGLASYEVVLATGGTLRKYAPLTTRELTFTPPDGSNVTGYLASKLDASAVALYAVTDQGGLFALDADLAVVWSMALGDAALTEPTIAPAAGTPGALPTLYVAAADGKLYAVAVDGGLDDAAPWPKGRHDAANSGDLGP